MISENKRSFLKSVSYTLSSNLCSFFINALILLVVPKLIGSVEYGYFQYYTLLATYTGYFHLGICNGIMLKYSGKNYKELNKAVLSSQHFILSLSAFIIFIVFELSSLAIPFNDVNKPYMFRMMILTVIFVNSRVFTTTVLQNASRFKEYSHIIMIEKILYAAFLSIVLVCGVRYYHILILGDVSGKIAAALLGIYYCRDIVFSRPVKFSQAMQELKENFFIGIFILVTNLASLLIPGIIQFFVEEQWSIETFGKVSLSFNISKMLMLVINATSLVLLPFLRRTPPEKLPQMYYKIRTPLMMILTALLLLFYPLRAVLEIWLPQYKDSLFFASLLFPMCLFESKTSMLINTYLKALRKEKWLCIANVITVLLSLVLSCLTVFVMKNLLLTVLLIPVLFAFRCVILEYPLTKLLKIEVMKDAVMEIIVAALFITGNYFLPSLAACISYLIVIVTYLFLHRNAIKNML